MNEVPNQLEYELNRAADELQRALQHAADAAALIKALSPRVTAVASLFGEVDALLRSGREQLRQVPGAAEAHSRPTLVPPRAEAPMQTLKDAEHAEGGPTANGAERIGRETPESVERAEAEGLKWFLMEFESRAGPLDLRIVDEALSQHRSVRDVTLLDFDGRKATLKVWTDNDAAPNDVRSELSERSSELFSAGGDLTIVMTEDAA